MSLKDHILKVRDHRTAAVEVPEWDTVVYVRSLTGADRHRVGKLLHAVTTAPEADRVGAAADMATWLVVLCACDQDGNRVFADDDFDSVATKHPEALDRVAVAAMKVNGLHPDSQADAKKD